MLWAKVVACFFVAFHAVTGVDNNQDLILCVKMVVHMGFGVHRGSWLLCTPVIWISESTEEAGRRWREDQAERKTKRTSSIWLLLSRLSSDSVQHELQRWSLLNVPRKKLPEENRGKPRNKKETCPQRPVCACLRLVTSIYFNCGPSCFSSITLRK